MKHNADTCCETLSMRVNASMPVTGPRMRALLIAALLACLPGTASARETIIWLVRDFPPLNIFSGPLAGQGAIDKLMPELTARMPEYDHQIMHVNRARGTQMLNDPDVFACDPTLLWTPERGKPFCFRYRPTPRPATA
jgi:uncharacterized protein (TIGR02285 family)